MASGSHRRVLTKRDPWGRSLVMAQWLAGCGNAASPWASGLAAW